MEYMYIVAEDDMDYCVFDNWLDAKDHVREAVLGGESPERCQIYQCKVEKTFDVKLEMKFSLVDTDDKQQGTN